jgi:dihydropteroate synthase
VRGRVDAYARTPRRVAHPAAAERSRRTAAGEKRTLLDPGYGFGKALDANYILLAGQAQLLALGRPLLAGLSRKSFLGRTLARRLERVEIAPQKRDAATAAASVAAILNGASVVRVHAVREVVEASAIADAILSAG